MNEKYFCGGPHETDDHAIRIYREGFPRITVWAVMDEFGNQTESDEHLELAANAIAKALNEHEHDVE